jgi:hypothetical protein
MSRRDNIDRILRDWPYDPNGISVRKRKGNDGRDVLQMRLDLGMLQLETSGRPDGTRPQGSETFYDHLVQRTLSDGDVSMSEEDCDEADREFVQYYHRRICWLALREFEKAVLDAEHTLKLMDFCRDHSPDEQWTMSHEQYRPFVMFHRIQAAALAELEDSGAEKAMEEIELGLKQFEDLYASYEAEDQVADDELVRRLKELKESIREHYEIGPTLSEELAAAVAAEEYERAAQLRDEIARRKSEGGHETGL